MSLHVFKGGFLLSRNFSVQTHVKFTRVNEIEVIYKRTLLRVDFQCRKFYVRKIYVRKYNRGNA